MVFLREIDCGFQFGVPSLSLESLDPVLTNSKFLCRVIVQHLRMSYDLKKDFFLKDNKKHDNHFDFRFWQEDCSRNIGQKYDYRKENSTFIYMYG